MSKRTQVLPLGTFRIILKAFFKGALGPGPGNFYMDFEGLLKEPLVLAQGTFKSTSKGFQSCPITVLAIILAPITL